MQVSYHKAIIEDCDYKIIMFYLYVYWPAQPGNPQD